MKLQNIETNNYNNHILNIYMEKKDILFLNAPFDKKGLQQLIKWFLQKYGEFYTLDFLEKLKKFGFYQANKTGISLGLDDLVIPQNKENFIINTNIFTQKLDFDNLVGNVSLIEKSQRTIFLWNQTNEKIKENVIANFRNNIPLNSLGLMAFSGARGNISQVQQLVGMRGLMADPQGLIVEVPIKSNFKEGITLTEYLISCFGARKGLVDTALRTATSGYLTRRLVDAVEYMIISKIDCKTNLGVSVKKIFNTNTLVGRVLIKNPSIKIEDKQKINSFIPFFFSDNKFNYYENFLNTEKKNKIISLSVANKLNEVLDEIYIRSPLTCKNYKSVCQLCYGWDLAKGDLVNIGEAVGIIAAQSIGEPGTQLTMRTFHTGGVGVFADEIVKTYKAPFNGIINLPEKLPGLLIRTSHGEIGYLLKYNPIQPTRILLEIKSKTSVFNLQEYQVPPGSLLMVSQGQNVKINDTLIQISQTIKRSSVLPEILYPVLAKKDGEVYFEYINIIKSGQTTKTNLNNFDLNSKKNQSLFYQDPENINKLFISDINNESNDIKFETFPVIPIINEISNFWLLSAQNQKEIKNLATFLRIGDLISTQTPLTEINYYIKAYSLLKIKQIRSQFIFNYFNFNLPNNLVRFHKNVYSFSSYNKNKTILFLNNLSFYEANQQNLQFNLYFKDFSLKNYNFFYYFKNFFIFNSTENNNDEIIGDLFIETFSYVSINSSFYLDIFFFFFKNIEKKSKFNKKQFLYFAKNISKIPNKMNIIKYSANFYKNFSISFTHSLNEKTKNLTFHNSKNLLAFSYKDKKMIFNSHKKQNYQFFLSTVNKFKSKFFKIRKSKVLGYKKTWVFIITGEKNSLISGSFNKSTKKIVLLKNTIFSNLSIEHQYISLDYFLPKEFFIFKYSKKYLSNTPKLLENRFYSKLKILQINKEFLFKYSLTKKSLNNFKIIKQIDKNLSFFKLKKNNNSIILNFFHSKKLVTQKKNKSLVFVSIQKLNKKTFQPNLYLQFKKKLHSLQKNQDKIQTSIKTNSPVFTKQNIFYNFYRYIPEQELIIQSSLKEGWSFSKNLVKIQLNLNSSGKDILLDTGYIFNINNYLVNTQKLLSKNKIKRLQSFQVICYSFIPKEDFIFNKLNYKLLLYKNEWVFPNFKLFTVLKFSQNFGEFISLQTQNNQTFWSSLDHKDVITLELPKNLINFSKKFRIGNFYRYNQKLFNKFLIDFNGKLIKINRNQLTFRLGFSFLTPEDSAFFLFHKNLIMKNQILFTLKTKRLETQDIVQGIPKIERLFEAREIPTENKYLTVQNKLEMFYTNALGLLFEKNINFDFTPQSFIIKNIIFAYKTANFKIQHFLVENIIEAYRNQGVFLAEKHVEIIVREMTTRVRILNSGSTGFLPGEILQFDTVQKLNNKFQALHKNPAFFDPIVLGISKSVLYSESFLLAASFQEVSRVLVRSALQKKTDFLLGLHENLIIGQVIPAGSGLLRTSFE
uniref:DNA-directed RNA polymerase n=1 Tax=Prototheca wickerhamii TaxID=3111 RepID=A0A873HW01_PROWI|nr:RNA polymerase beta'' subunit [Prototheca wickerhamii]QOZ41679.1 RNA polymerase beta'' subunit [Prototheca wickerhamii]